MNENKRIRLLTNFHLFMMGVDALSEIMELDRFLLLTRIKRSSTDEEATAVSEAAQSYSNHLNKDMIAFDNVTRKQIKDYLEVMFKRMGENR